MKIRVLRLIDMISQNTLQDFCIAGIEGPRGKENGRRQMDVNEMSEEKFNGATSMRLRGFVASCDGRCV